MTSGKMQRPPTQHDVARLAGVSRTTVSYVLNGSDASAIPDETRQRILDAAAQLGYTPNRVAQSLRTQKTRTIAGIIEDITNPFHPAFERGIQEVAEANGYDLIMYNTDGAIDKERKALSSVLEGRADGVIGSFYHMQIADFLPLLTRGIAVVRLNGIDALADTDYPLDTLFLDNTAAARMAVEFLIEAGHRRIAMLAGTSPPRQDRLRGYRQALEQHGIIYDETLVEANDFSVAEGKRGMAVLLTRIPRPTAVFAASDLLAMGAMLSIQQAGLRIPQEIAVVGFDDIFAAELVSPPLTTVAQFQDQMGRRAAEMLFERLSGRVTAPGRRENMPYQLIVRGSA
ncbi:MAG: LacI family DNA-binding transcriptional regulator [Chloroflexi bacterium]|nr:LacI family DNA-binding transcriptional regulator [Chloroflexota bacterium]